MKKPPVALPFSTRIAGKAGLEPRRFLTGRPAGATDGWQRLCKQWWMNWTQVVGLVAGVCTASSLLPQLIKTVKEKKADDISKGMLIVLMAGVATWIVYGFMRKDLPIIATNCFSFLLNIVMMILRIKYGRDS